jgi:hypothetical protein
MGRLLAGRYDELAVGLLLGLAATVACLAVWAWGRRFRPGSAVPVVGLALAAAGAAGIAATGATPVAPALSWPGMAVAAVLAGAVLAGFDRRWRGRGLAPPLLAISAAGVYACVPDVEGALVVLGVTLPMTLLGWPWPPGLPRRTDGAGHVDAATAAQPPSLGVGGALAVAGLLVWSVATGGAGRPGSVVGGLACLGLLAAEPLARLLDPRHRSPLDRLGRRSLPWSALAAHLLLVAIASRIVGRAETLAQALPLALLELAVALAVAVAVIRRPSGQRTAA